ncbi:formin-binding protein 4-like [Aricia agestis]|uniref:formin-binding protein 4-like n=1 Tax=Aricia agestis TaxID=91739 RepID=UPI001C2088BA|nr:formin-binding protein 4-like [Aricia agestis]
MSKTNPLGLVNYGDSDEESDDGRGSKAPEGFARPPSYPNTTPQVPAPAGVHPAPIPHCPWSACYDENSGFTYYWNQFTNAVTWEAPPEYLLALKLAQQQLNISGSTEVSAEEWQLYQQALAEKQNVQTKAFLKLPAAKLVKKFDKPPPPDKNPKMNKKRPLSDDEEEKIELITSYHNSDSESNDESDKSKDVSFKASPVVKKPVKIAPTPAKKVKKQVTQYGPSLPPNQNYSVPIGPEMPPQLMNNNKSPERKIEVSTKNQATKADDDENQDEDELLKKLKDKAKLLEKLGGELPTELQKIIKEDTKSTTSSPKVDSLDIDDLLQEIEKKELPKVKGAKSVSGNSSPSGVRTPPLEELKALYPNGNFNESTSLFPSAANIEEKDIKPSTPPPPLPPEKKENVYLKDSNEVAPVTRKKLRISNSVLPAKKVEVPSYTTKYSSFIEGFSTERTGLGFSKEENDVDSPKNTVNYGNGLTFTKGEVLNEEKKDESLDDLIDLVEAKLKYLNELQPYQLTQIQEMLIQLNVVASAYRAGALRHSWARCWAERAGAALASHEAAAAPPGWTARFERSERRYCYRREDGFTQWEYPVGTADMDICTTPPPPEVDNKEPPPPPPPPVVSSWSRATPPPPGTEPPQAAPPPPPLPPPEPKKEIGDELMSFYADIAELEKDVPKESKKEVKDAKKELKDAKKEVKDAKKEVKGANKEVKDTKKDVKDFKEISRPSTRSSSPEPPPPPEIKADIKMSKKKSKVKLSSSLGMKNKSVSSLVAKWQQVAEEIDSD